MGWAPRTALVTGASSGIGRGVALALAERGLTVIVAARRVEELEALASDALAREAPGRILQFALDVSDDVQVGGIADWLAARGLVVDLLINSAGYACAGPVETVSPAQVRRQFDVNVVGVVGVTQAVLPGMRRAGRGRIVNVSSVAGVLSLPFLGVYCASKFALEGLSDALRLELRPFGIDVCIAEPAATATSFADVTLATALGSPVSAAYAQWYDPRRLHAASAANAAPVEMAVESIVRMSLEARAAARTAFPARGRRLIAMKRLLSVAMIDKSVARRFGLVGVSRGSR